METLKLRNMPSKHLYRLELVTFQKQKLFKFVFCPHNFCGGRKIIELFIQLVAPSILASNQTPGGLGVISNECPCCCSSATRIRLPLTVKTHFVRTNVCKLLVFISLHFYFLPASTSFLVNIRNSGLRLDPLTSILATMARSCKILATSWLPWISWQDSY